MNYLPTVPSEAHSTPDIFLKYPPPLPTQAATHTPLLLLRINRAWTGIALSSPSLWANVHNASYLISPGQNVEGLEAWLAPARSCALSISIHGSMTMPHYSDIVACIHKRREQLQVLELYVRWRNDLEIFFKGEESFSSLKSLTIGNRGFDSLRLSIDEVTQVLRRAPSLEECTLDYISCRAPRIRSRALCPPSSKLLQSRSISPLMARTDGR
ncbi:hypothetical protein MVEN_02266400 [Mycena venus]|uniref:F-box domain-containing protein n=1 Tax=Mycena venus TaxID=2733690 RepID=A0A8H7CEK5_9AGAR|nr:hypothetical protein MVEN_02266400 [Mycena venus]